MTDYRQLYSFTTLKLYDIRTTQPIYGNHDDLVNLELNMSVQNLFGFATFWGKLGWDNYHITLFQKSHICINKWEFYIRKLVGVSKL